jgi:DNA-binding transcriptional LysR family regulator
VQLTPAAERLVEHTGVVLERLELAESELRAQDAEARGTVRLAIFQSAFLALLPETVRRLREEHPLLRVEVTQREPETALHETFLREFDLVVAEQYPEHAAPWDPGLDRVPLISDAIRLAVPPQEDWAHVQRLEDTAGLPWVLEPRGAADRHFTEQTCRRAGFDPDVRFETADLQAHVALIASGNAVALLPDLLWLGQEPPVRLVDLPGRPRRTVFTASPPSIRDAPATRAVREALGRAAADLFADSGTTTAG